MKKLTFVAALAIAAVAFSSCGNSAPKANLKTDLDSMSYAVGLAQTQGLKEYLVGRLDVDTAYMDDFIKGLVTAANAGDDKKLSAYYAGIQIGQQISSQIIKGVNQSIFGEDSTQSISVKNFLAGFVSGATGKNALMSMTEAQTVSNMKMMEIRKKELEKKFGDNKAAGEKFLADNKKKPGVTVLPSGVQYKVIKEGNGPIPADTALLKVNYEGRTIDGKVFESSYEKGKNPITIKSSQVIPGWTEVLRRMPVGSVWEVYIPQDKAYADRSAGDIKPFSTLIFKIELLSIEK